MIVLEAAPAWVQNGCLAWKSLAGEVAGILFHSTKETGGNMATIGCRQILSFVLMLLATVSAGCATVGDQRVDVLYQTSANVKGGSGDLYLVREPSASSGGGTRIQWVIGGITDTDGQKLGNIVTDTAPPDVIMNAFVQEFKKAGYNVMPVNSMPREAAKGLNLSNVSINVEEKKGPKVDVKCGVKLSVEVWRNGKALNKMSYQADHADSAITDREELPSKTMLQAIQSIMARAVPEIVGILEAH